MLIVGIGKWLALELVEGYALVYVNNDGLSLKNALKKVGLKVRMKSSRHLYVDCHLAFEYKYENAKKDEFKVIIVSGGCILKFKKQRLLIK